MIIIINKNMNCAGLALWPFIIVKDKLSIYDKRLMNHEKIHLRQEVELLIIPFYLIYGINWVINYLKYKSWYIAYKNIAFEREAYLNDYNLDYLNKRKIFSFMKYFNKKHFI